MEGRCWTPNFIRISPNKVLCLPIVCFCGCMTSKCRISCVHTQRVVNWGGINLTFTLHPRQLKGRKLHDQCARKLIVLLYLQGLVNPISRHDNTRPHTARFTTQFLEEANVNILSWSFMACSASRFVPNRTSLGFYGRTTE